MKLKLTHTKQHLLLIDEEADIRVNEWFYHAYHGGDIECQPRVNKFDEIVGRDVAGLKAFKKIIAYYPLTKEAKELDLPLLPPFENDKEMFLLAGEFAKTGGWQCPDSFIEGYKAAQSKQFSLEDIKEALKQFAIESGSIDGSIDINSPASAFMWISDYIQSLSTQQLPKDFIPEYYTNGDMIVKNRNGVRELMGTYKY